MFFKWLMRRKKPRSESATLSDTSQETQPLHPLPDSPRELLRLVNQPVAQAFNQFGFALAEQYLDLENKTAVLSPLSIETAFCLAQNGAQGETFAELSRVLNTESFDMGMLNAAAAKLREVLEHCDSSIQCRLANSLWLKRDWPFLERYLDAMSPYKAAIHNVDFTRIETAERINHWVSKATQGCISTLVDPPIDSDVIAMLINTLYFKGAWKTPFNVEHTVLRPFYGQNKTSEIPTMSASGSFYYYLEPKSQTKILRLYYGQGDFALTLLLPPEGQPLKSWWKTFPFEKWSNLSDLLKGHPGRVELPRFRIESDLDLIPLLKKMGLQLPFDALEADFSAMAQSPPGEHIYISQVKHKTVLEVNEEGAEAAAVTLLTVAVGCAMPMEIPLPFEMKLNRPFVCALQEVNSGLNLFLGCIQDLP